jgi:hypothetical protein
MERRRTPGILEKMNPVNEFSSSAALERHFASEMSMCEGLQLNAAWLAGAEHRSSLEAASGVYYLRVSAFDAAPRCTQLRELD